MSETRDKRRRTDLDLFVLALIDGGVSTPYWCLNGAKPRCRTVDIGSDGRGIGPPERGLDGYF